MWRFVWEKYYQPIIGIGVLLIVFLGWRAAEVLETSAHLPDQLAKKQRQVVFHSPGGEIKRMWRTKVLSSPFVIQQPSNRPEQQDIQPVPINVHQTLPAIVCLGTIQGEDGDIALIEYDGKFHTMLVGERVGNWQLTKVDMDSTWWSGEGEMLVIRRKME